MNSIAPQPFLERIHRLAIGFEPLDALRQHRITHPVRIDLDRPLARRKRSEPFRHVLHPGDPRPVISRHDSCLHALLYHPALAEHVDVVIFDHDRKYVPRRMRIPILSLEQVLALEQDGNPPFPQRIRRPTLFPGAAYDVIERTTGLRGRVLRDGQPMRWARVEARLPDSDLLVGRAHGDDRGEFLLVIEPHMIGVMEDPYDLRVVVSGPAVPPTPDTPQQPSEDPYWDLPLETVPAPGDPDPVSPGDQLPDGYVSAVSATQIVPFQLGIIVSRFHGIPDFEFSP